MFDIRIYTFVAVCECMNFTKAAQKLNITQPAVSQHIHYLEEYYKTKLFEYKGRRLILTDNGKMLYEMVLTFIHDDDFYKRYIKHKSSETLPMRFGVTKTIGNFVISKRLAFLAKKYPNAYMRVMVDNTKNLLEALRSGELHFALVEGYFDKNEFDYLEYRVEKYCCVCSTKHVFKEEPKFLRDLTGETLILREKGSGTRNILEKRLDISNMSTDVFKRTIEIDSMHIIRDLLVEDCGISFLYEAAVKDYIDQGKIRIIDLKDFVIEHEFTFVWNKNSVFRDVFLNVCKDIMSEDEAI